MKNILFLILLFLCITKYNAQEGIAYNEEQFIDLWETKLNQCKDLDKSLQNDFTSYQLHTSNSGNTSQVKKTTNFIKQRQKELNTINRIIANCDSKRIVKRNRLVKDKDSIVKTYIQKKVEKKIKTILNTRLENFKPYTIDYLKGIDFWGYIKEELSTRAKEIKEQERKDAYKLLRLKAKKSGVSLPTIKKVWRLITKRKRDLELYKNSRKNKNEFSLLSEDVSVKNPSLVKKEFSKNIASLITIQQYGDILGEQLKPIAKKKTNIEIKEIAAIHKFNKKQREEIYRRVALYYYNETVYKNYYSYDRRLLKRKLSGLKYHFEKDYKKIMDDFNIKIKSGKIKNREFEY